MLLKKFRLQSPDEDNSGTDIETPDEEMEPEDIGEPEQLEQEQAEASDEQTEETEELVIALDEPQEEEEQAPNWVKELRRKNREDQKRIRELEAKLNGQSTPQQSNQPPKKPKIEEFDYDADEFEKAMDKYVDAKSAYDREQDRQRAIQEESEKEWGKVVNAYESGKTKFPADKMKEAEEEVVSVLPMPRRAMLMDAAEDSTLLTFALGTNPETLRKLAAIKSDAKYIAQLARIEMNIKAQPKNKTAPPPERTISGSGKTPGASSSNLDRLKADADKSGDYTKYFNEKRRLGK